MIQDLRGTAFVRRGTPDGWVEIDSTSVDTPGPLDPPVDPYAMEPGASARREAADTQWTGRRAGLSPYPW